MLHEYKNGYVKSETHNHITTIEFYHPQSNSLPAKLLELLAQEIHAAGLDDEVRVIILKSAGEKAFCAGASFSELMAIQNEKDGLKFFSGFAQVINAMRKCPKFIIARVHGKCVGGGVGLAAASDYAVAVHEAQIKLSELAVGIGPFVIGPVVEKKLGLSAFMQLSIDATNWRSAEWARRNGLFAEVYDDMESLDNAVQKLSYTLSHSNPEAMKEMKNIYWQNTSNWDELLLERAAISGKLALSTFTKNAIEKFKTR